MNIPPRLFIGSLLGIVLLSGTTLRAESLTVDGKTPGSYSEEKPDYMYFKQLTITRKSKNSYSFDITLHGKIPNNLQDKISYYVGFDIDNNSNTGSTGVNDTGFGQDIGAWIIKEPKTNRFTEFGGDALVQGKSASLKIISVKVNDDKISFDLRSPLFGDNESFKVFVSAALTRYEKGLKMGTIQVDTLQPTAPVTLKADGGGM